MANETTNVVPLLDAGVFTAARMQAFRAFDAAICEAINTAKSASVPQGLIVAALHGYAHAQTAQLIEGAEHG